MSTLESVVALGEKQKKLEQEISTLEDKLKDLYKQLKQLKCTDLPELMEELGLASFKLESGGSIEIKRDLRAYILKADEQEVYKWLEENNHGAIIKSNVVASFERGEIEKAKQLYYDLIKSNLNVDLKENIHWATLKKFVKECLENGYALNNLIQIQTLVEAKIK